MEMLKQIGRMFYDAGVKWWNDDAPRLGATIAFYTIFSLSPLVLFAITVSTRLFFEREQVQEYLVNQFQDLVGKAGAEVVTGILQSPQDESTGILATVVALVTLFIGTTAVFVELRTDLNRIWQAVEPKHVGVWQLVRERLLSFALVLVLGFLLLVSLVMSAALAGVGAYLNYYFPDAGAALLVGNWVLSFLVVMALFAMMFRLLPDAKIAWGDVWIGAGITTLLFNFGKFLIGYYLGTTAAGSPYGAAGSFVVFLMWIYYSTQILLYGAELTQLFAVRFGSGVAHSKYPGAAGRPVAAAQA